jgi:hypothetical protein
MYIVIWRRNVSGNGPAPRQLDDDDDALFTHKFKDVCSPFCKVKSSMVRLDWHVAHMGKIKSAYGTLIENMTGRGHLEDLLIGGRAMLEWILKN